jgi:hypothetical protein
MAVVQGAHSGPAYSLLLAGGSGGAADLYSCGADGYVKRWKVSVPKEGKNKPLANAKKACTHKEQWCVVKPQLQHPSSESESSSLEKKKPQHLEDQLLERMKPGHQGRVFG